LGVEQGEFIEDLVNHEEFFVGLRCGDPRGVFEGDAAPAAAPLLPHPRPRLIHENPAHGFGGGSEEVAAVFRRRSGPWFSPPRRSQASCSSAVPVSVITLASRATIRPAICRNSS
jgi:hypothetical protein